MKKSDNNPIANILSTIILLCFIGIPIFLGISAWIYNFKNPEMTQMQMFLWSIHKFSKLYIAWAVSIVIVIYCKIKY